MIPNLQTDDFQRLTCRQPRPCRQVFLFLPLGFPDPQFGGGLDRGNRDPAFGLPSIPGTSPWNTKPPALAEPGAKKNCKLPNQHHARRRRLAAIKPKPPNPIKAMVVGSGTVDVTANT